MTIFFLKECEEPPTHSTQGSLEHTLRTTDSLRAEMDCEFLKTEVVHVT